MRLGKYAVALCMVLLEATVAAAETGLRRLDTADDGRGWEAVGRLNLGDWGFCTGALVEPDVVLTAAHCLYDKATGQPVDPSNLEFLAGWRNGRAEAYRKIRETVVHPRYVFENSDRISRVAYDLALLRLDRPIRLPGVSPFATAGRPSKGDEVGVVSYAEDRAEAPSLQEACSVLAGRPGVLMLSCDVNFGSSGAPIFSFSDGEARIVSVVSSKAALNDRPVALGTSVSESLALLQARLHDGEGVKTVDRNVVRRFGPEPQNATGGAKFVRP